MTSVVIGSNAISKLESFLNDTSYQELTQNSARFNVSIRKDRVYRQPYIDGQTGIAQRHCGLFISGNRRMPGILQGQVYTYPAKRWKSQRRSYLTSFMQAPKPDVEEHTITTVENPAAILPSVLPEEVSQPSIEKPLKEQWAYYEENPYEEEMEEEFESEEDFDDETYTRKGSKKKKVPAGRKSKLFNPQPLKPQKRRIILKAPARLLRSIKKDENDTENKPYVCELCGMRYKTRPGLTYHYAHSHREEEDEPSPGAGGANQKPPQTASSKFPPSGGSDPGAKYPPTAPLDPSDQAGLSNPPHQLALQSMVNNWTPENGVANGRGSNSNSQSGVSTPGGENSSDSSTAPSTVSEPAQASAKDKNEASKSVASSPYCDFCLGDSAVNKKTGQAEELVSCADCGRSGHPTCLQFTENMMKSVTTYRWQCIECKTCTLCGTSENDDQLLFCDDCDRGYHLYCLSPPLSEPPEGEWSCDLCLKEFHNK